MLYYKKSILIFIKFLIAQGLYVNAAYATHTFSILGQGNKAGIIELSVAVTPTEIDQNMAKTILVESFINEYQKPYLNILPADIGEGLKHWRGDNASVQKYYENYFAEELADFVNGHVHYWVQAKINGKLVGWATFQLEPSEPNAVYMNLLVVLPEYQNKGVGRTLVFSCMNLKQFNQPDTVHLLLRKKNEGGRIFYKKLGFFEDPQYHRADNFVDSTLLEGWSWTKDIANRQ